MKTFLIFFLILNLNAVAQTNKLQLTVEILPELKEYFFNQNASIQISIFDSSSISHVINGDINNISSTSLFFDSLSGQRITISLSSALMINSNPFRKNYHLIVDNIHLLKDTITNYKLIFPENCDFNKNCFSNICPKCKHNDRVVPILYGLPEFDENGFVMGMKSEDYELAGCMCSNCDPTWYCKRDSIKF